MSLLSEFLGAGKALFRRFLPIFGITIGLCEQILPEMFSKGVGDLVVLDFLSTVTCASFTNQQSQLGDFAIFFEGILRQLELAHGKIVANLTNVDVKLLVRVVERNAVIWLEIEAHILKTFNH